ncbi:MAG: c-type cytochrome [Deltaproteobacteria bacterium]|nr:c-type cytochrome [Deltaproteobacteria bacterium]
MRAAAITAIAVLLLAPGDATADDEDAGRAAIERYGCARCHLVPGFEPDPRTGCVACHRSLQNRPRSGLGRAPVATHFVQVPDLTGAARRLRPDALAAAIRDPYDARPHLEESMPRLPVSAAEAEAIADYLGARTARLEPAAPPPSGSRVERGRAVFATAGCTSCHVFGNVDFGTGATADFYRSMRRQALLAPNLRFVRDRMDPAVALAWIVDPTSVDPTTRMPRPAISYEDAMAVRDFLYLGELGAAAAPQPALGAGDLPLLDRVVRFDEVRSIFSRSCVHCHAKTTGTGTTAALGFEGVALDLSTRDGVLAGAIRSDGTRRSVVEAPTGGGLAPLIQRLVRRHAEAPRDVVPVYRDSLGPVRREARDPEPVGMPLGLPPVPAEDIRVIATWIAQGAN